MSNENDKAKVYHQKIINQKLNNWKVEKMEKTNARDYISVTPVN